jgi:hypothetical protein
MQKNLGAFALMIVLPGLHFGSETVLTPGCTNASALTKGVEVQWNGKPG